MLFLLLFPTLVSAKQSWTKVYVYKKQDGSHLITSKKQESLRYKLVKTYKSLKKYSKKRKTKKHQYKKRKSTKGSSSRGCNSASMKKRAKNYKRNIQVYSRIYGVDEALVHAIIKNESCFNPKAQSPVGAIGLMQLMPGTAKEMKISNPWDAEQNIQAGVKYISLMLSQFKGNKKLALAAYNAGPGSVQKYKGIPPFRETRGYVKRVIADYKRMRKTKHSKR